MNNKYAIFLLTLILNLFTVRIAFSQVHILYTSNLNAALTGCHCPGNPFGGVDRIVGTIKAFKSKHKDVLTVDSGDMFGTYADSARDELIFLTYQQLPYDIILPGDQEMIYGIQFFRKKFREFPGIVLKGALTFNDPNLKDFVLIKRGDITIAFIGWHTDESFSYIHPSGLTLEKKTDSLIQRIKQLRKQADAIVLVSHCGYDDGLKLVEKGVKPDIIIGGHSQDKISTKSNSVLITQAGMDGEAIGHISIFKKQGKIIIENSFIPIVESSPIDPVLHKKINVFCKRTN